MIASAIFLYSLLYSLETRAQEIEIPNAEVPDYCLSPIYCTGTLLHTVQMAKLYPDSKTFVDLYQKHEEAVTLANFYKLLKSSDGSPSKAHIREFVDENFSKVDELELAKLPDWKERPHIADEIKDPHYRNWTIELNQLWANLARRIKPDVQRNPSRYSIIYVDNSFIIPGGRFKEFYYWDSYWIIEGLLLSGMKDTAKGMINNFLSMIDKYGFIPNGGRVYYLMRSQPPLLPQTVWRYSQLSGDLEFARSTLPQLEAEFHYWHDNKTVRVKKGLDEFSMARYLVTSFGPRPESYREDYEAYEQLKDDVVRKDFYQHVRAGAETGWDFSARWLGHNGEFVRSIGNISTSDIIPVDLNAFLERNAKILSDLHSMYGNEEKSLYYGEISKQYRRGIKSLLWNEDDGTWYDFNIRTKKQNKRFYCSNLTPLYTQSFDPKLSSMYGRRSAQYLNRVEATRTATGSIPASLDYTGQQWDYPNAWAPLVSIIVQGLYYSNNFAAKRMARNIASKWLENNYDGFLNNNEAMFEKYHVEIFGSSGGGGEYAPQTGFGWTNGVVLEFLKMFPDLKFKPSTSRKAIELKSARKFEPMLGSPILKSVWNFYS